MGVIPKTTVPLAKFIRTGEGVLVFAFNLTMLIVPIVSNALTPEDAVKWAGIVNGVAVICRTGLKVVSVMQGVTGIPPAQIGPVLTPAAAPAPVPVPAPAPVAEDVSDDEEFASPPPPDEMDFDQIVLVSPGAANGGGQPS